MRPADLAWAAGFLDGEGYITVARRNPTYTIRLSGSRVGRPRGEGTTYRLMLTAVNRNERNTQRLLDVLGGHASYCHRTAANSYHKWSASGNQALLVLERLLPYLVGKREVALAAIDFQRWWAATRPTSGHTMPADRRARADAFYQECRRLNGRYRHAPPSSVLGRPRLVGA